jgi:hypothetical protein
MTKPKKRKRKAHIGWFAGFKPLTEWRCDYSRIGGVVYRCGQCRNEEYTDRKDVDRHVRIHLEERQPLVEAGTESEDSERTSIVKSYTTWVYDLDDKLQSSRRCLRLSSCYKGVPCESRDCLGYEISDDEVEEQWRRWLL